MKVRWEGVMPAMTTKFTAEDSLDLKLFNKNLEAQLEAGAQGIILGGTLGEASTLTTDELRELTRFAVDRVQGKVPVIVNIAEGSTKCAVKKASYAEEDGASGLMLLPPMRYYASQRETVEYLRSVARNTALSIMLYNNPVDYKIEITRPMFEQLLEEDNIAAVKESTRDLSNVTRLANAFGDRLKILCGVDTLALESLLMGAHGWVAGLVCAFPRETAAIYYLAKAGKVEEAREIYRWFMPLLELDINPRLVQNIKLAEVATGLGSETVRPPRLPLEGAEREAVLRVIEEGIKSRPSLPELNHLMEQSQ